MAWGGWGSSGSSLLLSTLRASTPVSGTSLWLRETYKCRNVMCRRTRDDITFWTKTEVTGWCKQTNLMYEWIVREPWWSRYRASVLAVDVVDWWRLGHFGPARTLSSSPSCSRCCQSHYKILIRDGTLESSKQSTNEFWFIVFQGIDEDLNPEKSAWQFSMSL